jgi:predicted nucleic acid-binding protein
LAQEKFVKPVFADTFYWIALALPADAYYARARKWTRAEIITTDEVLGEYLNYFSRAPEYLRRRIAASLGAILEEPDVHVIEQSRPTFLSGVELFTARPDKGYSLTDCISMQTTRREELTEVLTNDYHFDQEGFRALFRDY